MIRRLLAAASVVTLLVPVAAARAQYPGLRLSYVQPTGSGGPTDSFEVWVRLTLDPTAAPLTFDASLPPDYGLPPGFLPTSGFGSGGTEPFATISDIFTNTSYVCSGTFTNGCTNGTPYDFNFHTDNSDPTRPSFNFRHSFTMNPGDTFDYLFGTFVPSPGPVAPGTYTFAGSNAILHLVGQSAGGTSLQQFTDLARNCTGAADCTFTRTVVAVTATPEPATVLLMVSGLAGIGYFARRRRTA